MMYSQTQIKKLCNYYFPYRYAVTARYQVKTEKTEGCIGEVELGGGAVIYDFVGTHRGTGRLGTPGYE